MKTIKISTFKSMLHDSELFDNSNKEFIESIEKKLENKLIFSNLEDYDCDLKLIFIESGGSEMLFKNNINKLKEPYYFLTSGKNNSLAATLEILTYLNTNNLHGEIIHGDIDYIVNRILSLSNNKSIDLLNGNKYGIIGKPSDWLISSIPDYKKIEQKFNIKLIDIDLEEINKYFMSFKVDNDFNDLGFDKKEVYNALKVNSLLENIVEKYDLSGLTIRCFDLLKSIKTTGCLGLAKLNQRGIIATCEGDIMAMISMAIIKKITNQSSFQANPSRIDVNNNSIVFAHCTIPLDMVESYNFNTHFESGIGVAIKGNLKKEKVTIFRLSSDLKTYFVCSGTIINNLNDPSLCRTQIEVKMDKNVSELLTNPCGNHHIICYGDFVEEINKIMNS